MTPDGSVLIGRFHLQILFCFVLLCFHFLFPIFDLIQFYSLLHDQLCSDDGPSWSETSINLRYKRFSINKPSNALARQNFPAQCPYWLGENDNEVITIIFFRLVCDIPIFFAFSSKLMIFSMGKKRDQNMMMLLNQLLACGITEGITRSSQSEIWALTVKLL